MVLRKSSGQRAPWKEEPWEQRLGGLGETEKNPVWVEGVAGGRPGDSRGLMVGPCGSSEGLAFAVVRRVWHLFHKETGRVGVWGRQVGGQRRSALKTFKKDD